MIYEELHSRITVLEQDLCSKIVDIKRKDEELASKDEELASKDKKLASKDEDIKRKEERIVYLERLLFGSKRDKSSTQDGPTLFDSQFAEAMNEHDAAIEQTVKEIKTEAASRRKKSKEKPKRPEKYQYHGLEERVVTIMPENINPADFDIIGKDVSRILRREPAKVWVEVVERPILRHKEDKNQPAPRILQAPARRPIIGGNHVGADLLAQLVIDKFTYHIPEYRQVKQYADMGVKLSTSTVNNWIHAVASKLYPLYESLGEDIRSRKYLQIDEVPWRIADTKDKCRHGYAWQFFDATPDSHGLYFYYHKGSRSGTIPRAQLKGYRGTIQTDGYAVYNYFEQQDGITLLGCMAHVRRKFNDAQNNHPDMAAKAVGYIDILYDLEANMKHRNASAQEKVRERQEKAIPIMDTMEAWMQTASGQCTPSDSLGKALDYAYKLWPRLKRYTLDGIYQLDNNAVERCQRPSVMGRKNYLFCKNNEAAMDNAVFYSLLESCEVVGVNPLRWLTHTLNNLHGDMEENELIKLLPYNYKKSQE